LEEKEFIGERLRDRGKERERERERKREGCVADGCEQDMANSQCVLSSVLC
jgi:hypothetical protein